MFLFLVALVFFGLIVDVAEAIKLGPTIIFGLRFFEDAGELVIHGLILWYVFVLAIYGGKSDLFLYDFLGRPQIQ